MRKKELIDCVGLLILKTFIKNSENKEIKYNAEVPTW